MPHADIISPLETRYSRGTGLDGHIPGRRSYPLETHTVNEALMEPQTRWIALLGLSVSSRNQGVQALGASLVSLCVRNASDVGIRMLLGHAQPELLRYRVGGTDCLIPVVNFRLSPRSTLRDHLAWIVAMSVLYRLLPFSSTRQFLSGCTPWIQALEQSVFSGDIRGGDSFSDIYGMKRFVTGFLAAWTVVLVKGSIVQFPQTYGPFKSPVARWLARFLMLRSSIIMARDKASRRVAQELVGPSREVLLSPDVAFALQALRPESLELTPPLPPAGPLPAGVIGVNVNGLMYQGGYTRDNMFGLKMDYPGFLRKLLMALLQEQSQEIWLVPHTYAPAGDVESDPEASYQLRDSLPPGMQTRVRILAAEYDPHEVKGVIGMCDFFIGSRMHSCIAALSQGIPCVGVAYSMKFHGVFESVGMENWVVDGRSVDDNEAVRRIIVLYRDRARFRKPLQQSAASVRKQLVESFQELMKKHGFTADERVEKSRSGKSMSSET